MANREFNFSDIFLAGIGAVAMTGEKAAEMVDSFIEKGALTVEQGKALNTELAHKASQAGAQVRNDLIASQLKAMTPEERDEFAATVAKMVADSKEETVEAEVVEDVPEEAEAPAEDAAEAPAKDDAE